MNPENVRSQRSHTNQPTPVVSALLSCRSGSPHLRVPFFVFFGFLHLCGGSSGSAHSLCPAEHANCFIVCANSRASLNTKVGILKCKP